MGVAESFRIRLAEIQREAREARKDPSRWPFREAAAVLSRFVPAELRPVATSKLATVGWNDFLLDCEPASNEDSAEWWQLREDIRRETFRRLETRERMQQALNSNPQRSEDELQRALTAEINGEPRRPLHEMSREEISALVIIRDWLGGILDDLPSETELRRALVTAEILTPMQRLAGGWRFIGRQNELATLREYVGVIVSSDVTSRLWRFVRDTYYDLMARPPLLITGPGGVGKSSLVARFILDHSEKFDSPEALPFVYLDLDRATLDPTKPLSLVADAALQLAIEWPHLDKMLSSIAHGIRPLMQLEKSESFYEGSRNLSQSSFLVKQFGEALAAGSGQRPVLFVIDTFEEAQFRGFDVVLGLGELLADLQKAAPMLRIVLSGRADLKDQASVLPTKVLALGDLSKDEARELLHRNINGVASQDSEFVEQIISLVGRNPLSLKLASTIVNDQGVKDLEHVDKRNRFLLRVKAEVVQSRLYGRIFAHIHDDDAKKLLNPGLLLRRLTANIIEEVLAEPCKVSMKDPRRASQLMELLSSEVALFVHAPDGSLQHRPELRRIMLKDLTEALSGETIRDIHDRAVRYYAARPSNPNLRAEEIYHRLLRGDETSTVESRWIEGVESYLQTSLEEVPPAARIWLSRRLGITPDRALLQQAELQDWEIFTAQSVQRRLNAGDATGALALLSQRSSRSDTSPLYHLESEALRLLGRWGEAREVAEHGMAASARAGAPAIQRNLISQCALIEETAGNLIAALAEIDNAMHVPGDRLQPLDVLRLTIAKIRLLRKIGPERDQDRHAAIDDAIKLLTRDQAGQISPMQDELNQRPALLREVVAELGALKSDLLNHGLEILGLESVEKSDTNGIGRALANWDEKLRVHGGLSEIAQRAGLTSTVGSDDWRIFASEAGSRKLSSDIINWRAEMEPDREVDKAIVDFYRSGVDAALSPTRSIVK